MGAGSYCAFAMDFAVSIENSLGQRSAFAMNTNSVITLDNPINSLDDEYSIFELGNYGHQLKFQNLPSNGIVHFHSLTSDVIYSPIVTQ